MRQLALEQPLRLLEFSLMLEELKLPLVAAMSEPAALELP